MIEQMLAYPDLSAKLVGVTDASRGIDTVAYRLLTESGAKVAVNERIRGRAIEMAIEAMRSQVEEKFGLIETLVPFAGGRGHSMLTAQSGGELR